MTPEEREQLAGAAVHVYDIGEVLRRGTRRAADGRMLVLNERECRDIANHISSVWSILRGMNVPMPIPPSEDRSEA